MSKKNTKLQNGECVANKCKNGRMQGTKCICPTGTELIKDECKVE